MLACPCAFAAIALAAAASKCPCHHRWPPCHSIKVEPGRLIGLDVGATANLQSGKA